MLKKNQTHKDSDSRVSFEVPQEYTALNAKNMNLFSRIPQLYELKLVGIFVHNTLVLASDREIISNSAKKRIANSVRGLVVSKTLL